MMPPALLNAHAEELPRLIAEESLIAAERTAVGTNSLRKGVGSRITSAWSKTANQRRPVIRAKTAAEHEAHMRTLGIGVKRGKAAADG